jgi:hypothetical protein
LNEYLLDVHHHFETRRKVLHLAISRYYTAALTTANELMVMLKKRISPEIRTIAIRQESKMKLVALSPPV